MRFLTIMGVRHEYRWGHTGALPGKLRKCGRGEAHLSLSVPFTLRFLNTDAVAQPEITQNLSQFRLHCSVQTAS